MHIHPSSDRTITTLVIKSRYIGPSQIQQLHSHLLRSLPIGCRGVILDFSKVWGISSAALAVLSEHVGSDIYQVAVACIHVPSSMRKMIQRFGLESILQVFNTQNAALASLPFTRAQLHPVKALILSNGRGRHMAPLTWDKPIGLLEILGRTVLQRQMQALSDQGLKDFIINPSYHAPSYQTALQTRPHQHLTSVPEGMWKGQNWAAKPLGSASSLTHLQKTLWAFQDDFLVLKEDMLIDLDIADLMQFHRQQNADVTLVSTGSPDQEPITQFNPANRGNTADVIAFPKQVSDVGATSGVYVFSPRVLAEIKDQAGQQIERDLIPHLLQQGRNVQTYRKSECLYHLSSPRSYYQLLSKGLTAQGPAPDAAVEMRPGIWVADGAMISPKAKIEGPCYIGKDAQIAAGSHIVGPTVIGAGAQVETKTVLRRAVILNHTCIQQSSWADSMIVAPDWAVAHDFADGMNLSCDPLPGVRATEGADKFAPPTILPLTNQKPEKPAAGLG